MLRRFRNPKAILAVVIALVVLAFLLLLSNAAVGATRPVHRHAGCTTVNTFTPDRNPHPRTPALIQVTYCGPGLATGSWWCARTADRHHVTLQCRKVSSRPHMR